MYVGSYDSLLATEEESLADFRDLSKSTILATSISRKNSVWSSSTERERGGIHKHIFIYYTLLTDVRIMYYASVPRDTIHTGNSTI